MRRSYVPWTPKGSAVEVVRQANAICAEYADAGYDLTLRQLYYQFVARGLIPNTQKDYKRLGDIVNKARLAGLIDWDYIVDRTRNLASLGHWDSPADIIGSAAASFRLDHWDDQPTRVEVWVEKEALAGVVGQVAARWDCAYFSCRGYVSQSELWGAAQRLRGYLDAGQAVVVLHLGDHDPSGIDMTRDIEDRLNLFIANDWYREHDVSGTSYGDIFKAIEEHLGDSPLRSDIVGWQAPLEVRRIALNMDQVEEYDPPPNPAKLTDSRVGRYLEAHGDESWELDALPPDVLDTLIDDAIAGLVDDERYQAKVDAVRIGREGLRDAARRWDEVVELLEGQP